MIIIPMTGKMSWRNPPLVTVLLILANCFVYFAIQPADNEIYRKAEEFYAESGLARMELEKYAEYLKAADPDSKISLPSDKDMKDPSAIAYLRHRMMADGDFMRKLSHDEIIKAKDSQYPQWKALKRRFEQMRADTIVERYGYKPDAPTLMSAVTYMFLHGSGMHLFGNMLLLWLVGCTLEPAGSRPSYVLIYLATGVASAVLFGLIYSDSSSPLIGASAAISGIVGAFTVLFGMSKVRVFYSLGFYFNYARVPAVLLLPVWIGNEFFQLFLGGASNVAYVGHIGGLVSGAALGFVQIKALGRPKAEALQESRTDRIASLTEAGLQKFSELDLRSARSLMLQVLELDPDNRAAHTHLFNIDKLDPERDEFHTTTTSLLLLLHRDPDAEEILHSVYQEYSRLTKHPKLSPDLWSRLSSAFSHSGHLEDASKIVAFLLRAQPQFPAVPTALLNLSRAYLKAGMSEKGGKCLRLLCRRYPGSPESRIADELIKGVA